MNDSIYICSDRTSNSEDLDSNAVSFFSDIHMNDLLSAQKHSLNTHNPQEGMQLLVQDLLGAATPPLEYHEHPQKPMDTNTTSNEVTSVDYTHVLELLTNNMTSSNGYNYNSSSDSASSSQSNYADSYSTNNFSSNATQHHPTGESQQQQYHYNELKLPSHRSKRFSLGISLDEVEAMLSQETSFNTRKNSLRHNRRSSIDFLEPLISCVKSHSSFSQLLEDLHDGSGCSSHNKPVCMGDRENATFDDYNPHVVTPCNSKSKSLLTSLLDQFNGQGEQDVNGIGNQVISDLNAGLNHSVVDHFHDANETKPSTPISSTAYELTSPSPSHNSINPNDSKPPLFFDISFATKYQNNLKALASRMEQTSKSRSGLEEVKRYLSSRRNKGLDTEETRFNMYGEQTRNMLGGVTSPTSIQQHHHYQQNSPLAPYSAIKHSRRQQKSKKKKKKKACSPTKSTQVTMKKKRLRDASSRDSNRSLTFSSSEDIFAAPKDFVESNIIDTSST